MAITLRSNKGSALTYAEMDGNFTEVQTLMEKALVSPKDHGAAGDGVTDDTSALQSAIDAAEIIGGIVDGGHYTYAISSQISIGGAYPITLKNINFIALSGTWPSGTNGAMLKFTASTNRINSQLTVSNVTCNANNNAKTGFHVYKVQTRAIFIDCHTHYFSEYGFWVQSTGDGNNDIKFIGCNSAERLWTADTSDAYYDLALRTAYAWYHDYSADVEYIGCTGHSSLRCLMVDGGGGYSQFTGCKYWAGPTRTSIDSVTVEIDNSSTNTFNGCRFDDGSLKLSSFLYHKFVGCRFQQYSVAGAINLVASSANETGTGLSFVGNTFHQADFVDLTTTGSGSWTTLNVHWIANNYCYNNSPATINGYHTINGDNRYSEGVSIIGDGIGAELFTLDGASSQNRLFGVNTAGNLRWRFGATATAETGSNSGSNFGIYRYDDSGNYIDAPISIVRSTGITSFWFPQITYPGDTAPTLSTNGAVTFELTNNTTLTFKARGSDGTTRSGTVTLS